MNEKNLICWDLVGTLWNAYSNKLIGGVEESLYQLKQEFPNTDYRLISIVHPEKLEIRKRVVEGIKHIFDDIIIIPGLEKLPEHFMGEGYTRVFAVGDRPSREIQAANKARAYTILVQDPSVSKRAEEKPINELENPNSHRKYLIGPYGVFYELQILLPNSHHLDF